MIYLDILEHMELLGGYCCYYYYYYYYYYRYSQKKWYKGEETLPLSH